VINFPAGLLVYWITTNTWTMGQQYYLKRRIAHMAPPAPLTGMTSVVPKNGSKDGGAAAGSGGIGALLKRARGEAEDSKVSAPSKGSGAAPPPPPPRKKKKRSGRRR
jgi:YidC/Oxa1 family membrane protein insertase